MASAAPDQSAVLLRVPVKGRRRRDLLPPAPPGTSPTVTLGSQRLADAVGEAVAASGYLVAGVAPSTPQRGHDSLDVLVSAEMIEVHGTWFEQLLQRASRAFDCDLGPVQYLFREELAQHRRARRIGACP